MHHYHGTPIGGTRASADEFATGRFVLIPWKRPEDLQRAMTLSRGFIVDNSAYSFWRNGHKPNWMEYIDWCRSFARHPRFQFALIPDVIDGTEEENDNLLRLWDRVGWTPIKITGCPVWHLHKSLERLDRLCDRFDHVALGSSGAWSIPGLESWFDRMDDAWDVICDDDGQPRAKTHGLRMLRSDIVSRYPFASCDSTNAVQNGIREAKKNGVDGGWGKATIARRIEMVQSPSTWVRGNVQSTFELTG